MDSRAERMVTCLDGEKETRIGLDQLFGVIVREGTVFVDSVHHGPRQREQKESRIRQGKVVHIAEGMAFRADLRQQHAEPHRGVVQQSQAPIGNAHHQGRRAIMAGDDSLIGEKYF